MPLAGLVSLKCSARCKMKLNIFCKVLLVWLDDREIHAVKELKRR